MGGKIVLLCLLAVLVDLRLVAGKPFFGTRFWCDLFCVDDEDYDATASTTMSFEDMMDPCTSCPPDRPTTPRNPWRRPPWQWNGPGMPPGMPPFGPPGPNQNGMPPPWWMQNNPNNPNNNGPMSWSMQGPDGTWNVNWRPDGATTTSAPATQAPSGSAPSSSSTPAPSGSSTAAPSGSTTAAPGSTTAAP